MGYCAYAIEFYVWPHGQQGAKTDNCILVFNSEATPDDVRDKFWKDLKYLVNDPTNASKVEITKMVRYKTVLVYQ